MKHFKRVLSLILALSMVCALLTGCARKHPDIPAPKPDDTPDVSAVEDVSDTSESEEVLEAEGADVSEEETPEESETEAAPEETASPVGDYPYDYTVKMDVTGVNFDTLSSLNNDPIPYGFAAANRDNLNRPDGIYYYDNIYGEYGGYTHIDTEEKVIYLTMDEGYETGNTPTILQTLKDKGVGATFFITKQFYDEHPDYIQQMIDEGHIVGNHTCAHPAGGIPQMGAKAEYEDIKNLNDLVYDTFGYQMRVFRNPEGVSSKQSIALLNQMGYKSVFWSFAYRDWVQDDQMEPKEALKQCLDSIHPGAIYLLHAESATNTQILGDFIDGAREKGYEFAVFPVED